MSSVVLHSRSADFAADGPQVEAGPASASKARGDAELALVARLESSSASAAPADVVKPEPSSKDSTLAAPKRPYPAPTEIPTQPGPSGLRFDFNDGCRVTLPETEHPWRVRLSDLDTGNILFESELKAGRKAVIRTIPGFGNHSVHALECH